MSPLEIGERLGFHSLRNGRFMAIDGPGRSPGAEYCRRKLCFSATDLPFLAELLRSLAQDPDCYFVKYSTYDRDGIHLGRCFFLNEDKVGRTWALYKAHPKLLCSVQDDQFTRPWREKVQEWQPDGNPVKDD